MQEASSHAKFSGSEQIVDICFLFCRMRNHHMSCWGFHLMTRSRGSDRQEGPGKSNEAHQPVPALVLMKVYRLSLSYVKSHGRRK